LRLHTLPAQPRHWWLAEPDEGAFREQRGLEGVDAFAARHGYFGNGRRVVFSDGIPVRTGPAPRLMCEADPLVALALLFRLRLGILLVLGLTAIDLTVNLVFLGVTGAVIAQIAYTMLALAALPVLRRRGR